MHMIFYFCGQPYAVPNASIREMFKLPELTAVEQSIACLSGTVNCRGNIIPVLDFAAVMGHPRGCYHLDDVVMVLDYADRTMGLVVSDVSELQSIAEESIVPLPANLLQENQSCLVRGQATGRDQALLSVLDIAALFTHPAAYLSDTEFDVQQENACHHLDAHFDLQRFDAAARKILSERARNIARRIAPAEPAGSEALAIIHLSGESFGIRLDGIREFAVVRRSMPLPSCPAHIAGSMNLRGEVLLLLDLRAALHLAERNKLDKVVVMRTPELGLFGLLVDGIAQVVHSLVAHPSRLPAGLDKLEESYLSGLAHWDDSDIPVLDISAMLVNGGMIVNETV